MQTKFKDRATEEWLKLYKAALKNEIDETAQEIVFNIWRMKEINEQLQSIIEENEIILAPQRRTELRTANSWLKGVTS